MLFTMSLTSNKDFTRLYKGGRSIVTPALVCYYRMTKEPYNRVGITASKKLGNAVQRNRARRVIREAYRQLETAFPIGCDMVFVARGKVLELSSDAVRHMMRARILKQLNDPEQQSGKPAQKPTGAKPAATAPAQKGEVRGK